MAVSSRAAAAAMGVHRLRSWLWLGTVFMLLWNIVMQSLTDLSLVDNRSTTLAMTTSVLVKDVDKSLLRCHDNTKDNDYKKEDSGNENHPAMIIGDGVPVLN